MIRRFSTGDAMAGAGMVVGVVLASTEMGFTVRHRHMEKAPATNTTATVPTMSHLGLDGRCVSAGGISTAGASAIVIGAAIGSAGLISAAVASAAGISAAGASM